jgi:hypothetical protein
VCVCVCVCIVHVQTRFGHLTIQGSNSKEVVGKICLN